MTCRFAWQLEPGTWALENTPGAGFLQAVAPMAGVLPYRPLVDVPGIWGVLVYCGRFSRSFTMTTGRAKPTWGLATQHSTSAPSLQDAPRYPRRLLWCNALQVQRRPSGDRTARGSQALYPKGDLRCQRAVAAEREARKLTRAKCSLGSPGLRVRVDLACDAKGVTPTHDVRGRRPRRTLCWFRLVVDSARHGPFFVPHNFVLDAM